jgi:type II secretory pathway pseudopilin PulG
MASDDEPRQVPSDAEQTTPPKPRGRLTLLELLVVVGITCLLISILLPPLNRMRQRWAERDARRCVSNLRQIGQALHIYVSENGGVFPDTLAPILTRGDLVTAEVFVCPWTDDSPARGDTPEQLGAQLGAGGHLSYVYVGAGLKYSHGSTFVVAYDRPENHAAERGGNVVFADVHVDWVEGPGFQWILDEVAAGRVPVDISRRPGVRAMTTNPTTAPVP